MTSNAIRLFAYGSLMKGEPDHGLVAAAEFVGTARTLPAYKLVDLGPFPALIEGGTLAIEGELYLVDAKLRFAMDVKYQCPVLFHRAVATLEDGSTADTYAMREDQVRGKRRLLYGDWRKRFAPRPRPEPSAFVRAARDRWKPIK
jgi:gamma-glutamylaminecyclotransferase